MSRRISDGQGEKGAKKAKAKRGEEEGRHQELIIKIVPLVLIALVVAKMTVLKPPPPTAAQVKAKAAATKLALDTKCALANGMKPPKPPTTATTATKGPTTPTTVAELAGPSSSSTPRR